MGSLPPALAEQLGGGPDYTDYAGAICAPLQARYAASGPTLVREPGVGLVADSMHFASTVVAVKEPHGRRVAVLTGGRQNIKPTDSSAALPVVVWGPDGVRPPQGHPATDLTGYTCMEADTLVHAHRGEVCVGDLVVVGNVGAYSTVFKPPFIRPAPPILAIDGARRFLARRGETLTDLLACYQVSP